jgi:hypothetical protein
MGEPPTTEQADAVPRATESGAIVGPERSGRVVVLVFIGAAVVVIAAGAWFLRWAGDLSHEGLVPGSTTSNSAVAPSHSPPASPPGTSAPKP